MMKNELSAGEASGILEVISKYSNSFKALKQFDDGRVIFKKSPKSRKVLNEVEALKVVRELKKNIGDEEPFGETRGESFTRILKEIYKKVDGEEIYKTVAEKASNLLYLVVRERPFKDGNKRIGALLFIIF